MESAEELVIDTVVTKLLALIDKGPRDLSSEQLTFLKSHLLIARDRFHIFTSRRKSSHWLFEMNYSNVIPNPQYMRHRSCR
jgi:hypothetical protein